MLQVQRIARPAMCGAPAEATLFCVSPASRSRVAEENRTAALRVQPGSTYCISGYVWREAFPGDLVCVTPQIREIVREENRIGPTLVQKPVERLRLVTVSRTPTFGGPGGGEYEISCPFGSVMTGLRARHGLWIDALAPICSRYVQATQTLGEIGPQPLAGGTGGGEGFIRCHPPRGVIVSLEVYQADNKWGSVGHIVVNCGDYLDPKRFANKLPGSACFLGNSQRGTRSTLKCTPPLVAGGIIGRSGIYVDRVGLSCVDYRPR